MIIYNMGGEGSMQHMINSLKNNKKLLRRKNRFENEKAVLHRKDVKYKTFKTKKASPEIIEHIRKEAKKTRRNQRLLFFIISFLVLSVSVYFIYDFNQNHIENKKEQLRIRKEKIQEFNTERIQGLLEEAEQYLEQGNWTATINKYSSANAIFPNYYDLEYRLV